MRDENCIFCKIIAGEIPSNTIYEDDEFKVVLDVSPASKGHALILPKNHYADLYEIDENVAADAMKLAKKLAIHMTDVFLELAILEKETLNRKRKQDIVGEECLKDVIAIG